MYSLVFDPTTLIYLSILL